MAKVGDNFGSDAAHHEKLTVSGDDLYWNGKKLRTESWTRGEKIALCGIVVAAIVSLSGAALSNWEKWEPNICSLYRFSFCPAKAAPQPSTPQPSTPKPASPQTQTPPKP